MKRTYVILTLAIAVAGAALGVRKACAGPGDPPAKMPLDVAIRFDRDMAHVREAQTRIAAAQAELKPFADDADDIAREFKIDWPSFFNGTLSIDYKTGEIKRPASAVAPAAPDMGKPEARKK